MKINFLNKNLALLFVVLVFTGCQRKMTEKKLSQKVFTYEYLLSSISSDDHGYWVGGETGYICHVDHGERKTYSTGLDRIYDVVRDDKHHNILWIASRNAGLQKWKITGSSLVLMNTYKMKGKGSNYSPYDILLLNDTIYLATSQGLYCMSIQKENNSELRLLYPFSSTTKERNFLPNPVIQLCPYKHKYLYAVTTDGLLRLSITSGRMKMLYRGQRIKYVYVKDNKLSALTDKQLFYDIKDGRCHHKYNLDIPAFAYFMIEGIHYFLGQSSLELSTDMKHFFTEDLGYEINSHAHNLFLADDGNGFSVLLAGNSEIHIPHHLDIGKTAYDIIAGCHNKDYIYLVTRHGRVYRQNGRKMEAEELCKLPEDKVPLLMEAIDNKLYYVTASNKFCFLSLRSSYLLNQLFAKPKVLFQSSTHVTAMAALPYQKKILLGIQDELLRIDANTGKIDTVKAMQGKYITSFYTSDNSNAVYICTLNDGVYYYSRGKIQLIKGTEKYSFIKGVELGNSYDSDLFLLTNHQLLQRGGDRLKVDGNQSLYLIGDSLLYTLPQAGVHCISLRDGHLINKGTVYGDIQFMASSSFLFQGRLYLGSDLGEACFNSSKRHSLQWITFNDHVISLQLLLTLLTIFIILCCSLYFLHRVYNKNEINLVRQDTTDLKRRIHILNLMIHYLGPYEAEHVKNINQKIETLNIISSRRKNIYKQLSEISAEITLLNRDAVLQIVKALEEQIQRIREIDYFDSEELVKKSKQAIESSDVNKIVAQFHQNKIWIEHVEGFKKALGKFEMTTKGALILRGVNDGILEGIAHWKEEIHEKKLSDLDESFNLLSKNYNRINTEESVITINHYLDKCEQFLLKQKTYNYIAQVLLKKLHTLRDQSWEADRVRFLHRIQPVELRIQEINTLHKLRKCIRIYVENEETDKNIVSHITIYVDTFFNLMLNTDKEVIEDIFHYSSSNNQQVKVLTLLLADASLKRTLIPGLLGIYGNLNPVISRLYHSKIENNIEALRNYYYQHPDSMVYYILKLIK
jgi:chorismate mutase